MIGRRHASLTLAALAALAVSSGSALAAFFPPAAALQINPAVTLYAPPGSTTGPLNILHGSTGFDVNNLPYELGANAQGQSFGLGLGKAGITNFAPGSALNFTLSLPPDYTGPTPTLIPISMPANLPFTSLHYQFVSPPEQSGEIGVDPEPGTSSPSPTPTVVPTIVPAVAPIAAVPEPGSLALLAVAAGLGLLRARAFRRARRID